MPPKNLPPQYTRLQPPTLKACRPRTRLAGIGCWHAFACVRLRHSFVLARVAFPYLPSPNPPCLNTKKPIRPLQTLRTQRTKRRERASDWGASGNKKSRREKLVIQAMDLNFEEEESWKCRKHPSQPRNGICPTCLRDRLLLLCPECATVRPCACYHRPPDFPSSTSPSSSSSLSSKSSYAAAAASSSIPVPNVSASVGAVGRISSLIDAEPPFQRSRSSALHFLQSRSARRSEPLQSPHPSKSGRSLFRWLSRAEKSKTKVAAAKEMRRSRSIGDVPGGDARLKGWGWHFPSPIKVFRQPRTVKLVHERSPLYRG